MPCVVKVDKCPYWMIPRCNTAHFHMVVKVGKVDKETNKRRSTAQICMVVKDNQVIELLMEF